MKQVHFTELEGKDRKNAINEVRILASIKSQNVIGFREAFMDPETEDLW